MCCRDVAKAAALGLGHRPALRWVDRWAPAEQDRLLIEPSTAQEWLPDK